MRTLKTTQVIEEYLYLPIQNCLNTTSSTSSAEIFPVTLPNSIAAFLICSAKISICNSFSFSVALKYLSNDDKHANK